MISGKRAGASFTTPGDGTDRRAMAVAFPGVLAPGEPIRRFLNVRVFDGYLAKGRGQLVMLDALAAYPAAWFWGMDVSLPARHAWAALARKGWVDLHWNSEHQLVMVRITPAGLAVMNA